MEQIIIFSDGKYTQGEIDFGEQPSGDWHAHLASLGWEWRGRWPQTEHSMDYAEIEAFAWRHRETRQYLVEITVDENVIENFLCPQPLDFLLLLRDLILPLAAHSDRIEVVNAISHAAEYLFDPEHGLDCAVNVQREQRRQTRINRQNRREN